MSERMVVSTLEGKKYEIDSFCPHKGQDLSSSPIIGGILECPRHHWLFDLERGGECVWSGSKNKELKKCTINAKRLDW